MPSLAAIVISAQARIFLRRPVSQGVQIVKARIPLAGSDSKVLAGAAQTRDIANERRALEQARSAGGLQIPAFSALKPIHRRDFEPASQKTVPITVTFEMALGSDSRHRDLVKNNDKRMTKLPGFMGKRARRGDASRCNYSAGINKFSQKRSLSVNWE
ncbi:hypothetical protein ZIOFF_058501 [Zingiber officinale]|uniref:Uncharacterized protein n=1 Tax=Zingiber officinale TaxID=94328 RepID=A0A8J5KM15_ZINOF|nr:hypothetical protein ZIOFF_058501 [Zingiber officinale]